MDLKKKIIPAILGFVYAVCLVFGHSLEKEGSIAYRDGRLWLTILILGILLSAVLTVIMKQLQKRLLPKGLEHEAGHYPELLHPSSAVSRTSDGRYSTAHP